MPEARFNAVLGGSHHLDLTLDLPTDFPTGEVEIIVRSAQPIEPPDAGLEALFAAIDRMPRRRLTKEEIDTYIAEERASWD
ncbi:hypothetical protein [Thiorhodococcus minor]|uniref:Uncharacterized protein n=1 Tax=Thiorhodococcus minor TaxID=57489 RepID=A0A6M0K562_9GAMM|nr:hypothetical protein [Thiorhodococcus minor]NEV64431.1 hypothetical protein [Thiorhodococcus minor]